MATDPDGATRYCCRSDVVDYEGKAANLSQHSIQEIWNSPAYKKIRQQFLRNEKPKECSSCFNEEAKGKISKRLIDLKYWSEKNISADNLTLQTSAEGSYGELPLSYDLRLGNTCNLKCRMCHPYNSSAIQSEYAKLFVSDDEYLFPRAAAPYPWWEKREFIDRIKAQGSLLRRLNFAGGEPAISKEVLELLKHFVDQGQHKNIHVEMTTNLTHLSDGLLQALSQYPQVQINCSIDAYQELNTYMRFPSDWSAIERNLKRYADLPQVTFSICATMQVYNALRFTALFEVFVPMRDRFHFTPQVLFNPPFLHVSVLPQYLREEAKRRLLQFAEKDFLHPWEKKNFIAVSKQFDVSTAYEDQVVLVDRRQQFVKFTQVLDRTRGQKCLDVIPELAPLFEGYPSGYSVRPAALRDTAHKKKEPGTYCNT